MIRVAVGQEGNMEWPQWADNFISAYMIWSEVKDMADIEFSNMGRFIGERAIPLSEFKQVITVTYTGDGLKSTETHFVFGWNEMATKALFISQFDHG